ncbi:MAG: hypothetical protein L6R42_008304, partial [Xanthoria sp. 1 TBL-2021]
IETARAIAATGAKVLCTVRDVKKGESALADILKPGQVALVNMDLNSLESVRSAAKSVLSQTSTLNILINNAGIMATPTLVKTADGFESQFGTNHLAHFLLFELLKPTLLTSSTPNSTLASSISLPPATAPVLSRSATTTSTMADTRHGPRTAAVKQPIYTWPMRSNEDTATKVCTG